MNVHSKLSDREMGMILVNKVLKKLKFSKIVKKYQWNLIIRYHLRIFQQLPHQMVA